MAKAQIVLGKSGSSASPTALVPVVSSDSDTHLVKGGGFSSGNPAYYVFDGNDSTYCTSNGSSDWYVGYQFDSPVVLNKITLKTRPSYSANNKNQLEYLINGSWTPIIGMYLASASTEYTYPLDGETECSGFRVRVASGVDWNGFYYIQVYGSYA